MARQAECLPSSHKAQSWVSPSHCINHLWWFTRITGLSSPAPHPKEKQNKRTEGAGDAPQQAASHSSHLPSMHKALASATGTVKKETGGWRDGSVDESLLLVSRTCVQFPAGGRRTRNWTPRKITPIGCFLPRSQGSKTWSWNRWGCLQTLTGSSVSAGPRRV